MNPTISRLLVNASAQFLHGQNFTRYLPSYRQLQHRKPHGVRAVMDESVQALISHAHRSIPYYCNLFHESGIQPSEIKAAEHLHKIPLLTKRIILQNSERLVDPNLRRGAFLRRTGGSTGLTLNFLKDGSSLARNDAVMWRCYEWYGIRPGDRQVRFWGVPMATKKRRYERIKDAVCNRIRVSAFRITREECLRKWKRILEFRPHYFYGYTTAIYGFVRTLRENGIHLNVLPIKAIICTAEKMQPHHRNLLESAFHCPIVDEYGATETGIIAMQCPMGNMHLMSDHLVVEFLDEDGRPASSGESARIVITDPHCRVMPLIRYDIGDRGSFQPGECPCGVKLPLMKTMEGRQQDFILTKSGKLIHTAYLCYALKEDFVHEFRMYQKSRDQFEIQIVKGTTWNDSSEFMLRKNLATELGDEVILRFSYFDFLPREESGKLRYFVSEIEK